MTDTDPWRPTGAERTDWRYHAACSRLDPRLVFPVRSGSPTSPSLRGRAETRPADRVPAGHGLAAGGGRAADQSHSNRATPAHQAAREAECHLTVMKRKWRLAMTSVPGPYGEDSYGYGVDEGGYGPARKPRRTTRLLPFLAVAVVAAGAGVGVILAVDQFAASTTTTSVPGAGVVSLCDRHDVQSGKVGPRHTRGFLGNRSTGPSIGRTSTGPGSRPLFRVGCPERIEAGWHVRRFLLAGSGDDRVDRPGTSR